MVICLDSICISLYFKSMTALPLFFFFPHPTSNWEASINYCWVQITNLQLRIFTQIIFQFISKKFQLFLEMCVYRCFCMHVYTLCVFGLMITRRRFQIPWNRSYRQCYLPCGTRKLNPGLLEKEPVFLIAKTYLQSRFLGLN